MLYNVNSSLHLLHPKVPSRKRDLQNIIYFVIKYGGSISDDRPHLWSHDVDWHIHVYIYGF